MSNSKKRRSKNAIPIGAADLQPGEKKIIDVDGKSIGVFNVNGIYYALHNRCPHMAGPLCEGPVCGTTMPVDDTRTFIYGRDNELVRCGWHGWEFEIKTGQALVNDKVRARTYDVIVENQQLIIHI